MIVKIPDCNVYLEVVLNPWKLFDIYKYLFLQKIVCIYLQGINISYYIGNSTNMQLQTK